MPMVLKFTFIISFIREVAILFNVFVRMDNKIQTKALSL